MIGEQSLCQAYRGGREHARRVCRGFFTPASASACSPSPTSVFGTPGDDGGALGSIPAPPDDPGDVCVGGTGRDTFTRCEATTQ